MNQVKLNELIKSKIVNIPIYVLRVFNEFNLTTSELIILLYLYDKDKETFNPNLIAKTLKMELINVMEIISSLSDKGLVNVITKENEAKVKEEVIDLSMLYEKITMKLVDEMNNKEEANINVFDVISSEFGRKLTPMECEMISSWKNNGYPIELIIEAVREATLNGVTSLRYIDKILYEWNKKGYKTKDDLKKNNKKEEKQEKIEIYNCDWLDSDEEL